MYKKKECDVYDGNDDLLSVSCICTKTVKVKISGGKTEVKGKVE